MMLETNRLIIRKFSLEDVKQLCPILGDQEVMYYSPTGALDDAGILTYVTKILRHYNTYGYGLWAVVLKNTRQLIGLAGLVVQVIDGMPYVELAYRLVKKYRRQGFGTEAVKVIKNYAFDICGMAEIISIIAPENTPSIKLATKSGLVKKKSINFFGSNVDIYGACKIVLLPYNCDWKRQYLLEKHILQSTFEKLTVHFHHIGSTSIEGMCARPVIDILGVINDITQIDAFKGALEQVGYIHVSKYGELQTRFFQKKAVLQSNLHILEDSDPEVAKYLRFQNYLASHPAEINSYSNLKKKLVAKDSSSISNYNASKQPFIKNIDYLAAKKDTGRYWPQTIVPR